MTPTVRILAPLVLFSLLPSVAAAGRGDDPAGRLGPLLHCRDEGDAARRLVCFDAAAATLAASVGHEDVVVVDREQIRAARRSLFGFALPRLPLFAGARPDSDVSEIADTIASARVDGDGNWVVVLRSGATWSQTDGQPIGRAPRGGDAVTLRRGSLGSYFMRIAGQPGVRARRIG